MYKIVNIYNIMFSIKIVSSKIDKNFIYSQI